MEYTGFKDNNNVKIYGGDKMMFPKHSGECCNHWVLCTVKFNPEWNKWGLQDDNDKEWLTGSGLFAGFSKIYNEVVPRST